MCFCLPLTVISLPQCTPGYWALQRERERETEMKRWRRLRGLDCACCWKKPVDLSAGIFCPSTRSAKWDPQQGLHCLCSLFIYSSSQWKTFSLILPLPTTSPVWLHRHFFQFEEGGEFLFSKFNSLTIRECEQQFNSACLGVCLHMFN